jgi:hypothetical protein
MAQGKMSRTRFVLNILIIAFFVLLFLGLLNPVGPHLLSTGRKAMAHTMVEQFTVALSMYYTEYNSYPSITDNAQLHLILDGGSINTAHGVENPRQIQFMSFNKRDINAKGEVVDPWGTPYRFTFDEKGVTVTSAGKDKQFGTTDDIVETKKWTNGTSR